MFYYTIKKEMKKAEFPDKIPAGGIAEARRNLLNGIIIFV